MSKNLYRRFSDVTGARKLRTVAVCLSSSAGESWMQYPGGGLAKVKGEGATGTLYFIFDGRLDGEAPALTALVVEI